MPVRRAPRAAALARAGAAVADRVRSRDQPPPSSSTLEPPMPTTAGTSRVALLALVCAAVPAFADTGSDRVMVEVPSLELQPHAAGVSGIIWMNRCVGGCQITQASID